MDDYRLSHAVCDESQTSFRLVFNSRIVVKLFADSDVWSVKVWGETSLQRTMKSWRTKVSFTPSRAMLERAKRAIYLARHQLALL